VTDIGVWMSREVLEHKRHDDVAVQVWNLRRLPGRLASDSGAKRLFVAVQGHWRGFFRLSPRILHNQSDPACPYALAFDPKSWTAIPPERAPPCDTPTGYSLQVPIPEMLPANPPGQENETQELCSFLEREEERE